MSKTRNTEDNATIKGCSELLVAFAVGIVICYIISVQRRRKAFLTLPNSRAAVNTE